MSTRTATLSQNPHARQFVKFVLVGVLTTALNFGIYAALVLVHVNYLVAAIIAFGLATLNSYTWNRIWTFRAGAHRNERLAKFFLVQLVGLTINLSVLAILVETTDMNKLVAQLIANVFVVCSNFAGNKFWTFRQ